MKTNRNFWRFVHICALALAMCALSACSESEDETPGSPGTPGTGTTDDKGDITFSISGGEAITSPAVVQTGDTLNMTISQRSTYKDPDGSVMTCEPKATIRLFASHDTIRVKDLKTLVSLSEKSSSTTQSGTAPVVNRTAQTFDVGGQEVVFDLGYEVYSLTNSEGETVEMPYVKVNPARDGAATTETRGEARTSVPVITLKPTARTRMTVTDSAEYEVTVKFNLDIESVNAKSENRQTMSFEVNYIGVVEDTRELPDPETLFSHELNVVSGTSNTASPFTLTSGRTLSLQWRQSSKYTYFSLDDNGLREVSCEPVASVKLSVATDTLWAGDAAELEKTTAAEPVVSSSGENPALTQGQRTFDIGGQQITAEWSYEAYRGAMDDGTEVALPYLRLGEVRLVDVSVRELPDAETPGKIATAYEVTARFSQDIASVDAPEETAQTVEYIVKYIGAVEATLVDVAYRKDFVWEDFNGPFGIEPCTRYILYRDRKYSNIPMG